MLKVIYAANQREAQGKFLTSIPIAGREDANPLDISINMFDIDSTLWNNSIINLLKCRQLLPSLCFYRYHAVGMKFFEPLKTFIRDGLNSRGEMHFALFKHLEVMLLALAHWNTKNISSRSIGDDLDFQSMPLLLAWIVLSLFFFGRSISHSVTSTSTAFTSFVSTRLLLEGKENSLLWIQNVLYPMNALMDHTFRYSIVKGDMSHSAILSIVSQSNDQLV